MVIQRVTLTTCYNQYESKRHFTVKLAEALERGGLKTQVFDLQDNRISLDDWNALTAFDPQLTVSFHTTFRNPSGKFYWEEMEVPHFFPLVDPAVYALEMIQSPYCVTSSVDADDVVWLKQNGYERVFYWPHAVEREMLEGQPEEKVYDVVFLGTCTDFEGTRLRWRERYSPEVVKVLEGAAEKILSGCDEPMTKVLADGWGASGLNPKEVNFKELYRQLDDYTRGKDRYELIAAIEDVPVVVFGEPSWTNPIPGIGWEAYLGDKKNVTVKPPVKYGEALQILRQSRMCLNSNIFFRDGSHERVLMGFACGCLPVTNDNGFIKKEFAKDAVKYTAGQWKTVNGEIQHLLSTPREYEARLMRGKERVRLHHTWDQRAATFLEEIPKLLEKEGWL